MDPIKMVFTCLLMAEFLIVGLAVKSLALVMLTPRANLAGTMLTCVFALIVLVIGVGTAAATLGIVIPAQWSDALYWTLLLGGYGISVAMPVVWAIAQHRRGALLQPQAPVELCIPALSGVANSAAAAPTQRPSWPHAQLAAGLLAIRLKRLGQARNAALLVLAIGIPFACMVGLKQGPWGFGGVALVALLFAMKCYDSVNGVSELEYRALPGASDASGKHRCVYCGKPGVYRHGGYASSSTWHQCTGCRKHLFVD